MKPFLLATIVASAFASPAMAANFNGPRVEARVGWDRPGLKLEYDDGIDQFNLKEHDDGLLYGVEAGYDFPMGENVVLGAYAGVDFGDAKRCSELFGDDLVCLKVRRNITAGVRAGGKLGNAAMVYAKGGYSNGGIKATYQDFSDSDNNVSGTESRGGWHLGAGIEAALGSNAYAKIEFVYTDYKAFAVDEFTTGDFDRQQVIGGFGFRF